MKTSSTAWRGSGAQRTLTTRSVEEGGNPSLPHGFHTYFARDCSSPKEGLFQPSPDKTLDRRGFVVNLRSTSHSTAPVVKSKERRRVSSSQNVRFQSTRHVQLGRPNGLPHTAAVCVRFGTKTNSLAGGLRFSAFFRRSSGTGKASK